MNVKQTSLTEVRPKDLQEILNHVDSPKYKRKNPL